MKAVPDSMTPTRSDRSTCQHCGATPGGCEGLHWLGRRWCCESCNGHHDSAGIGASESLAVGGSDHCADSGQHTDADFHPPISASTPGGSDAAS